MEKIVKAINVLNGNYCPLMQIITITYEEKNSFSKVVLENIDDAFFFTS